MPPERKHLLLTQDLLENLEMALNDHNMESEWDLDTTTHNMLMRVIRGRGAFRRFKDALHDVGLAEEWYEYKDRQGRRQALEWLYEHELISKDDIETGMIR